MEYYVLKDYEEKMQPKLNKKKLIRFIIIMLLIIIAVVLFAMYIGSGEFRSWTDKYIFGKEMTENTGAIIEIDTESNSYVYAYDKYIVILSRNHLQNYTGNGEKESEVEINISNPIFASNGKYICVAEKGGTKVYLISRKTYYMAERHGK